MASAGINTSAEDVAADAARWAVHLTKSWLPPFSFANLVSYNVDNVSFVFGYNCCCSVGQGTAYNHRNICRLETCLEGMAKLHRW